MNASLAIEKSIWATGPTLHLRQRIASQLAAASERVKGLSRRERVFASLALAGILLTVAEIAAGPRMMAYLGVLGLSALTNAVLFLPSGRGAILVAGALVLNPLAVAILTGIGGAVGELTGYALGRSSRRLEGPVKVPEWLTNRARRHMAATVLAVSIIPSPFVDTIGIVAGRLGYPLRLFLAYSIVGKVIQSIVFVYLALWNISLISSWTGLGA